MKGYTVAKPKKPTNAEHVSAFFAELEQAVPGTPETSQWLADLQRRARGKRAGWIVEAEAYLQGLTAAGKLSDGAAASCRQLLARCAGSAVAVAVFDMLAPLAWIAIVAAMALYARTIAFDTLSVIVFTWLAGAAGGVWALTRPWLDQRNNPAHSRWVLPASFGVAAAAMAVAAIGITSYVGREMQETSIRHFEADREALLADPQGFPMVRQFAHEHYGVPVVLVDAKEGWANTSLLLPSASPALMDLGAGHCKLNMHRANLLRMFGPVGRDSSVLWVQGVMVHELAHCLDMSRDMPGFGSGGVGTRSVAPQDAVGIRDIEGLVAVEQNLATQLWREAVADLMAVGFWKLSSPDAVGEMTANLRHHRVKAANRDKEHATVCWIDFASRAAPPSSMAALFGWADQLRSQAPCELPRRQAKASMHAAQVPLQR